ncbi:3-oxoacyl-(acyl carrier protein) synthase [Caballeronia temeraria]|uniref:3-oxoacyl-(Acyl carrier protein) synthase n=1 Tax=Caballeronia temeraria TaxID=1777137 RepID=A0A158C6D0_9BURK|nr:hypothetical protein [Caballeronia temeraria]SAK77914.1 3-oxoacyl-(acyl carrier protein) synthase [Caballeronia temeraria]
MSTLRDQTALARCVAWDAVTSLGESAAETLLLLRAGLCNVTQSRFVDAAGERVMFCRAPSVPPDVAGIGRIEALGRQALDGLCARLRDTGRDIGDATRGRRPALLMLCLSAHYEGDDVIRRLRECFGAVFPDIDIEVFPFGRAAGSPALAHAVRRIGEGRLVIWGGVDSLHDWRVLEALERSQRLLTSENVDGVRPGEAAAFIVLEAARAPVDIGVYGIGAAREPHPVGSEETSKAAGLNGALDRALTPLRAAGGRSNAWLLDVSHEDYAAQELQNVIPRLADVLGPRAGLKMPLKELGDPGAAAMPLLAVLAAEAWRLHIADDDTAVITGCSDDGARGAVLLGADDIEEARAA